MMNMISETTIETRVEQLLAVLDRDIQELEQNIDRLNALRSLLIKQDRKALEQLLQAIRSQTAACRQNETERQALRQQLAGFLGCAPQAVTLSSLQRHLPLDKQMEIEKRKNALQALAGTLKKEYAVTQMLLVDCARFNRLLLNSIFGSSQPGHLTYEPTGTARRQTDTVLMNMQF